MTLDDATLLAFVDGELDAVTARRVERAVADDPALGAAVAAQRALRARVGAAFADVATAPVPDRLAAMLAGTVVPIGRPARPRPRWIDATALAACLVGGVLVGQRWSDGSVSGTGTRLVASGPLARALDTQLASLAGETRVLLSFRDRGGTLCRVFAAPALDGIACRDRAAWTLRRTGLPEATRAAGAYRQAGSSSAPLLAEAQDMMAGRPLDAAAERRARAQGWR